MSSPNTPPPPAPESVSSTEPTVLWGAHNIPISQATGHFLFTGGLASGKTIITRILLQSALKHIGCGLNHRALIYDAKGDLRSLLAGTQLRCNIHNLNPFDRRGVAWDISADVNSPLAAQQLAAVLVPNDDSSSQPFFTDAARQLFFALCLGFINTAPGKWTLRDVLLSIRSRERILSLLPPTYELAHPGTPDNRIFLDTVSTLQAKLNPLEVVAAGWHHANEKVALQAWLIDESVLLLGNNFEYWSSLAPINKAIFHRLADLVLSQTESATRRTWMFFDEVSSAGRLDSLPTLLLKGRSKGACIVLTMQAIESIRSLYGPVAADELATSCIHKTVLRLNDPETAKWAQEFFCSQVFASEMLNLPLPGPAHGLSAFHHTPTTGAYFTKKPWDWVLANLTPPNASVPNEDLRPGSDLHLLDWTDEDYYRLGLRKSS
jgi:hypothetical protein